MGCIATRPSPDSSLGIPERKKDLHKFSHHITKSNNSSGHKSYHDSAGEPVLNVNDTLKPSPRNSNLTVPPPKLTQQELPYARIMRSGLYESGEAIVSPTSNTSDNVSSNGGSDARHHTKKAHRVNVFTKGYTKDFDFSLGESERNKTDDELEMIMRVLDACYVFANCSEEQKFELASHMFGVQAQEGEVVLSQGDTAHSDNFYAIQSGTFDFYVNGNFTTRRSGSSPEPYFGELALLFNSPRQATAICVSPLNETHSPRTKDAPKRPAKAQLWAIGRDTFRQILAYSNEQQREDRRAAVQSISLLRESLNEEQLNRVIECVSIFHFRQGQRIVRKGDPGDSCYFIKQGSVLCTKIGDDGLGQVELGPGSFFGERALLRDEPRAADVTALTDVVTMALDRKSFDELLGSLRSVMDDKMKERVVEALPILKELSPKLRREIVADFELETFREGDEIVRAGDLKCDKFYVVRAGEVTVIDPADSEGPPLAQLKEGSWFGEMALLNDEARVATCVAASPRVECFVLRRATFQQLQQASKILQQTSEQRRQSNYKRRYSDAAASPSLTVSPQPTPDKDYQQDESNGLKVPMIPVLSELEHLHVLGKGTFGTVFLVRPKSSPSNLFALKMLNKHHLVKHEQRNNVMNEKRVLLECGAHPFVLQLTATYQDTDSLFFLLEFVPGGELFSIMQDKFKFPLYPTMFYAACLADVLEHIHSKGIVYRDLKPENVLIDAKGYVKLADFGFAKKVPDKTYTLCGTPEYLAPEVVLGTGHDKGVDWWGLGVLIYEMLVGISPFADEYEEHQQVVCNNIVKGRVHFDKMIKSLTDTEARKDPYWTIPSTTIPAASQPSASTPTSSTPTGGIASRFSLARSSGSRNSSPSATSPVEDIVRRLLNKSSLQRLGNLKDGAKDVKRHPFFNDIQDWADLRARKVVAPFVPPLNSPEDTSMFDNFEADSSWPAYKGPNDWCANF